MLAAVAFAAQTVDGHVVNSVTGIDIPGVAVNLVQAGNVAYSATTDSQGHFRIEAVEAGTYTANYTARGFWPIPNFLVDEDFEALGRVLVVQNAFVYRHFSPNEDQREGRVQRHGS